MSQIRLETFPWGGATNAALTNPFVEGFTNKPPAFQFYAKDWRRSMNVKGMTREQRSIFIDMMAIAWDSEIPGTILVSDEALCHELGILKRTLRRLLRMFPTCWLREDGFLTQPKLHEQWLKYQEIQQKRSASAQQMHMQKGGSAFASASAPASAKSKPTPLPPTDVGGTESCFEFCRETIAVKMGRRKRLPSLEAYGGARAIDVVEFLCRRGFPARIVSVQ